MVSPPLPPPLPLAPPLFGDPLCPAFTSHVSYIYFVHSVFVCLQLLTVKGCVVIVCVSVSTMLLLTTTTNLGSCVVCLWLSASYHYYIQAVWTDYVDQHQFMHLILAWLELRSPFNTLSIK